MAGLLAARVLADHFSTVVVLERDLLPDVPAYRRGVPQARHLHGLLGRGRDILEEFFPGIGEELLDRGAISADLQYDIRWTLEGHSMIRARSGLVGLSMSRTLLEHVVRTRVAALPGVVLEGGRTVTGLLVDDAAVTVTGVRTSGTDGTDEERAADLVVDASGRGSRSPAWLAELGYAGPGETGVPIGLTYATRRYRREPQHLGDRKGAVVTLTRDNPRGGALASEEGDGWIITLAGVHGDDPPLDPAGFEAFAATLEDPAVADVARSATPLGDAVRARFPGNVRRHYEKLTGFPCGYLVVGDAICSFNPVYSQGMTVAAEEALVLRSCLDADRDDLARRFFRRVARVLDVPWAMATATDRRFGGAAAGRPAPVMVDRYLAALTRAVERDPAVGRALLRVANLLDRPVRLVGPGMVFRVVRDTVFRWVGDGDGIRSARRTSRARVGSPSSLD